MGMPGGIDTLRRVFRLHQLGQPVSRAVEDQFGEIARLGDVGAIAGRDGGEALAQAGEGGPRLGAHAQRRSGVAEHAARVARRGAAAPPAQGRFATARRRGHRKGGGRGGVEQLGEAQLGGVAAALVGDALQPRRLQQVARVMSAAAPAAAPMSNTGVVRLAEQLGVVLPVGVAVAALRRAGRSAGPAGRARRDRAWPGGPPGRAAAPRAPTTVGVRAAPSPRSGVGEVDAADRLGGRVDLVAMEQIDRHDHAAQVRQRRAGRQVGPARTASRAILRTASTWARLGHGVGAVVPEGAVGLGRADRPGVLVADIAQALGVAVADDGVERRRGPPGRAGPRCRAS